MAKTYVKPTVLVAEEQRGLELYPKVLTGPFPGLHLDAFNRQRFSEPYTVFDSKLITADKQALHWDEELESGSGITSSTPTAAKPYSDFTSTLNTAGLFTRQTFRRFNYQPGKSPFISMTQVFDLSGGGTGVQRKAGYFDDNNGLFFNYKEGVLYATKRSNDSGTPVDTEVAQPAWNFDRFDGTGGALNPSGFKLDLTAGQIILLDFQWLSYGLCRWGFEIEGRPCLAHMDSSDNKTATPWASTPNLPLRYQMETTGSSPASSMRVNCGVVISEGGREPGGTTFYESTGHNDVAVGTPGDIIAIMAIRLKSTALGITVDPLDVVLGELVGNKVYEWLLLWNPTIDGSALSFLDIDNSACQVALAATNGSNEVTAVGTKTGGGFGASGAKGGAAGVGLDTSLKLGASISGVRDELVLAVRGIDGASQDIVGGISWREE